MFVDQADIQVIAGDGGRGCVSFRKEKFVPQGGPDGGDGGDGGSVYLEAAADVDTLLDMMGRHHWRAEPGKMGRGKKQAGRDGEDLVIRVPAGTLVYDRTSGLLIVDMKEVGQKVRVVRGGKGGKGNIHFANSVRQAPEFAEPGGKGQVRDLHLELRLIADVGLVGLPNAGKSTLLSRFTHARPKIADYPFTTLSPQLGIAELDADRRLVIADIPGLIEGASEGAGLGLDFLRHIERTRVIVHMVDVLPMDEGKPIEAYRRIRSELASYSPKLAGKVEFLVANKMDLAGASEALADLRGELPGRVIFAISAVAGTGLRPLLEALWKRVKELPESEPLVVERPYVPLVVEKGQSDEEMFEYAEGEADEGAWEAVEEDGVTGWQDDKVTGGQVGKVKGAASGGGGGDSGGKMRERHGLINKAGEAVVLPAPRSKKKAKVKRTLIEPVKKVGEGGRTTAKERKARHDERAKKKKGQGTPPPVVDAELAAEVAAMKADDVRKGKYYKKGKR
ncbi:MAG: GTPase ObgE [Phycisphaerales bacterium]|nr:GTPase ObgE [Phycisphaerales bacterium]